jgi:hypothetical protein
MSIALLCLSNPLAHYYPHVVSPSTTLRAGRQHPTSLLLAIPTDLAIEITDHLAETLKWPMDGLRCLWATYSFMCRFCGDPTIGRRVAMDWCKCGVMSWNDLANYYALLASLTQLSNSEACFLTRIPMVFMDNHNP